MRMRNGVAELRGVFLPALIGIWIGVLSSCAGGGTTGVSEDDIQRAQAALEPFKAELQTALRESLRAGGPENAIQVCRDRAPQIAASLSTEGVRIGRTSYRLRNPKNISPRWVEPLMVEFLEKGDDRTFRAVRLPDGGVGYVEPIYVQPMCLACHGKEISPAVSEKLDAAYPRDNGRGFNAGDFRGVFWVRLSATNRK
jgi:hypothetical protein